MRIVFAGTPEFAVPSLHALMRASAGSATGSELTVVGVITREDAPLGRKRILTPSPAAQAADSLGLPVYKSNRLDAAATDWVKALDADLGVIVAYGGLLREPLLSMPRLGWINLHFSDLPRWRGAAPVQRALIAGEQRLGVTVFRLVEALDAGAVLSRDELEFPPGTSAGEALKSLATFGTDALLRAIEVLRKDPNAGEEQRGDDSYAHKLAREDGKLDLSHPAAEVLSHWAGVTPEPGAFVQFEDHPLKLQELRAMAPSDDVGSNENIPGRVRLVSGRAILELTAGALELVRVQPAGKPVMAGADWLRGRGGEVVLS